MRVDGRRSDEIREMRIHRHFSKFAPGSALVEWGDTRVLCTATIEEGVPGFLMNSGRGWVTAEYAMLPGSTHQRKARDARRGQIEGRTQEIQRMIGRALRSVVRLDALGERTLWLDCDVLQADGGTRTTAVNGAFVALVDCCRHLVAQRALQELPLRGNVAAVSVGLIGGESHVDLCYEEDSRADVDMNVVMNERGEFIEIQGGAEGAPFDEAKLQAMLDAARKGIDEIVAIQDRVLREI